MSFRALLLCKDCLQFSNLSELVSKKQIFYYLFLITNNLIQTSQTLGRCSLILPHVVSVFFGLGYFGHGSSQYDLMAKLVVQYLVIYNNKKLPHSIKICQIRFKILPNSI